MHPNLFVVGAAKAGTTSIISYLSEYENLFVSPIKEPNFFGTDFQFQHFSEAYKKQYFFDSKAYFSKKPLQKKHIAFVEKATDYSRLFSDEPEKKIRAEGSTSYLFSSMAVKEIYRFNPESKIIIVLRNPVERAVSHYLMLLGNGSETEKNPLRAFKNDFFSERKGFGISHLYVEMGLYLNQLKRYFATFPKDQILVLDFNDLKTDQDKIEREIASFLNQREVKRFRQKKNKTRVPKHTFFMETKNFKKLKPLLPPYMIEKIKNGFLYHQDPKNHFMDEKAIAFLKNKLETDWNNTRSFLKTNGIQVVG